MYSTKPGLILGFHGCDQTVVDRVLSGEDVLNKSENSYDWLGHGIYFWEGSPMRALEFAKTLQAESKRARKPIQKPAVLGAVLDLGFCLDLLQYENLQLLEIGYQILLTTNDLPQLPRNKSVGSSKELVLRNLDCAVIETVHQVNLSTKMPPFDSVKGVFWEGEELYPGAGFREKNHIQICIRNPNCIKGFFLPRKLDDHYPKV